MSRYIGIDVAKKTLEVAIGNNVLHLANSDEGICELIAMLESKDVAILEATGGYERRCARAIEAAGFGVAVVNPADVAYFRKSLGFQAKTDVIDAAVLARFGELRKPSPGSAQRNPELADLVARRTQLVSLRSAEKNRLDHAENEAAESIGRHIAWLDDEIGKVEKAIAEIIKNSSELSRKEELLISAPGVRQITAAVLLAMMPELGTISGRKIASLAGLAPHPRQSGQWQGQRRIGRGRTVVRKALFMAVLGGSRGDNILRRHKNKLREAGKAPKQAVIAVARKLLVTLNAMLRDGKPFDEAWLGTAVPLQT